MRDGAKVELGGGGVGRRLHEDAPRASPGATHPSFKERLALLADAGDRWWQAYKSSMEAWELTWGHGAR